MACQGDSRIRCPTKQNTIGRAQQSHTLTHSVPHLCMHAERRQQLHTWELHIPHLDTPIRRGSSSGRLTSMTVTHLGAPQLGHPSPEEVIAHLLTPSWRLKSTTVTRFGTPQPPLRHPNLGGCHRPSADLLWEAQVDDNYTLGSSTTQAEGPPMGC